MSDEHTVDIDRQVKVYVTIFVALMALTLATVAVSYLDLSTPAAIGVALLIATVKGSLVACYFMHLISERKLIYIVLILTLSCVIPLILLPLFGAMDIIEL